MNSLLYLVLADFFLSEIVTKELARLSLAQTIYKAIRGGKLNCCRVGLRRDTNEDKSVIWARIFKLLKSPRIDPKEPIHSLAGRYDNPIPSRFLAPIDCLQIPAQISDRYLKKFTNKIIILV